MKRKTLHIPSLPIMAAVITVTAAMTGCFTGVERTARIKDPGRGKDSGRRTEFLESAAPIPPVQWHRGKEFIVTEGRHSLAFSPASESSTLVPGDTLRLAAIGSHVTLPGDSVTDIRFITPRGTEITHRVEQAPSAVLGKSTLPIPFTIEADVVRRARELMVGKHVWTLTSLGYTPEGETTTGRKYRAVTITDVLPGNADFPLRVLYMDDSGLETMVYMVVESRSASSRSFENIFSQSDPRKKHPEIPDHNWDLITQGKIELDMTREECRLSLGLPASVERDAAYNGIIERWTYENGVYLLFTDGRLTRMRL